MAEDNTERTQVWGDELKYLINTAGSESPSWQDITHLLLGRRRRRASI